MVKFFSFILFIIFLCFQAKIYHIYPNTSIHEIFGGTSKAGNIKPGDIFQYHKGIHLLEQYMINLKGNETNHIIIKGENGVILENASYYSDLEYLDFIGPFEIRKTKSSYVGRGDSLDVFNSHYILITDFYIHDDYKNAIRVSGTNIIIKKNKMNECVKMNVNCTGSSWGQTIRTEKNSANILSRNVIIENNFISESWGEGIYLLYCEYYIARNNTIRNAHSVMMYSDNSRNLIIEKKLLQIARQDLTKEHRAVDFGIGTEKHGNINATNITIRNNLAISFGHGFQNIGGSGYYADLHFLHNTFYNTSSLAVQFPQVADPDKIINNHVSNNVFSGSYNYKEAREKNQWTAYSNIWIDDKNANYPLKDSKGYEGTSVYIKNVTLKDVLFPKLIKNPYCLEPSCFLPRCLNQISTTDKNGNLLIGKGLSSPYSDNYDFYGRKRDKNSPTIGFSEQCTEPSNNDNNGSFNLKINRLFNFIL